MAQIQYLTPEGGLPVSPRPIDASCKGTFQYGSIGQKGPLHCSWLEVGRMAYRLRARYILQTSNGTYYIKCYAPRSGHQIASSGEILRHVSECYSISGKSRVWILDYHDEIIAVKVPNLPTPVDVAALAPSAPSREDLIGGKIAEKIARRKREEKEAAEREAADIAREKEERS